MAYAITFVAIFVSLAFNLVCGRSPPTTVKTHNGQIYNCVNFYEQPAFRDHSLNLQALRNIAKIQRQNSSSGLGIKGIGCPIGTVPILDRSKWNVDEFVIHTPHPSSTPDPDALPHCNARVQTKANDPAKKFFGANAGISIYKPKVQSRQWSSSRIKLLNGVDSIEAGWMVNPNEFKDNEAHLYASFSAGGKGCINIGCSGFVQVSTDIPLGIFPNKYSVINGKQALWNLSIDKHQDDGNWWLSIKSEKHQIGYWPKNLLTTLQEVANQVEFGGEIDDPTGVNPSPLMGNGFQARYDTEGSSCFFHVTVVDENLNNINPPDTEKFSDCNESYTVLDGGYHDQSGLGRLIFYGGPSFPDFD